MEKTVKLPMAPESSFPGKPLVELLKLDGM